MQPFIGRLLVFRHIIEVATDRKVGWVEKINILVQLLLRVRVILKQSPLQLKRDI